MGDFLTQIEQTESASFGLIMRLLRRYEGPAERRVAEHVERVEALAGKRLATASEPIWRKLEAAMGVSAL